MLEARELFEAINEVQADMLIIDIELHFVVIVCLQLGLPIILTIAWFSIFKDDNLPPLHTRQYPPESEHEKQAIQALWKKENDVKRKQRIKQQLKHLLRDFFSPSQLSSTTLDTAQLRLAAKYHGINLDSLVDYSQWLRPMVFRNIPVMAFNVYEMDFPHCKHNSLHYVGPMIYEQRVDPRGDDNSIKKWQRLREEHLNHKAGRPLIYCSLGSFWNTDRGFLSLVIEVLKRRPDWHLVIGLGGKLTADAFNPLPGNVTVLKWAPQLQILELADCAITHGGITSINECVHYRVPMLVYSTAHGDQNGCAARVAWHGLGIMGDMALDDSAQIELHIESLINDPCYQDRLQKMQGHLQRYSRENLAVKLIEQTMQISQIDE